MNVITCYTRFFYFNTTYDKQMHYVGGFAFMPAGGQTTDGRQPPVTQTPTATV